MEDFPECVLLGANEPVLSYGEPQSAGCMWRVGSAGGGEGGGHRFPAAPALETERMDWFNFGNPSVFCPGSWERGFIGRNCERASSLFADPPDKRPEKKEYWRRTVDFSSPSWPSFSSRVQIYRFFFVKKVAGCLKIFIQRWRKCILKAISHNNGRKISSDVFNYRHYTERNDLVKLLYRS